MIERFVRLVSKAGATKYYTVIRNIFRTTLLLEATKSSWCWNRRLTLFLLHNHTRPITEYACPVWHPSLTTAHQAKTPETLQKRAMNIIFPDMDYRLSLIMAGVDTLEDRREALTERFFKRSVIPETSCLHYLLPDRRDSDIVNKLWQPKIFQLLAINTVKFRKSFIPYCLKHYQ